MKYIIIGFGGTGSEIVNEFLGKVPKALKSNFASFAIDTEMDKLVKMNNIPENNKIQISEAKLVKDMMYNYPEKHFDFMSKDRNLLNTQINTGAGQVRQISRFGYETVTEDLPKLIHGINELILKAQNDEDETKFYFVGSVCGGTGSGCMLQVSYFLQNYLYQNHGHMAIEPTAFLLLPGVFTSVQDVELSHAAKRRINANAYAFFKEWNTYNSVMQNDSDLPKYPELLELFLGEANGTQIKITKQDIENHTQYLQEPFKNFICIDAAPGRHYKYLQNYKDIVSDYLYATTTSDKAGEAPAKMVNNLGKLIQSQGINRYNSINSVKMLYPKTEMEQLASLVVFNETFSKDYVRLDEEYEQEVERLKEERRLSDYRVDIPTRGQFFTKQFMEYANAVPVKFGGFYKESLKQLQVPIPREEGKEAITDVFKHQFCFEKIKEYIKEQTVNLTDAKGRPAISTFKNYIDKGIERFKNSDDKKQVIYDIEKQVNEFDIQIEHLPLSSIHNVASGIFNYKEKATSDAIHVARNSVFNPLYYILGSTAERDNHSLFNPVTARFFLYQLNQLIKEEKDRLFLSTMEYGGKYVNKGVIPTLENKLKKIREEDYLSKTEETETPIEAIEVGLERDEKWGFFKSLLGSNVRDFWDIYEPNIKKERDTLVELYIETFTYKVLEIVSIKIDQFAKLWENYFININTKESKKELAEKVGHLSRVIDNGREFEIFYSSDEKHHFINSKLTQGDLIENAHKKVVEKLVNKTVDTVYHLAQTKQSLDVEKITFGMDEIAGTLQTEFSKNKVFNKPLMETWVDVLTSLGYSEEDRIERIKNDINRLKISGTPLIQPVQNAQHDVTYSFWMLNDTNEQFVADKLKNIANDLGTKLSAENVDRASEKDHWSGQYVRATSNMIKDNELILTSLNTNFNHNNIQAFKAPENPNLESVFSATPNAGVYFKSYYTERINEWKSSYPSVHIDERWSGIGVLQDFNNNIDHLFVKEVNKAFVRALAFDFFISTKNDSLQKTWRVNITKYPDIKNTFILDHEGQEIRYGFSDLYFALYDNLELVLYINGYIDEYGNRHKGIFETYFEQDDANQEDWMKHKFIEGCLRPISFIKHPHMKYNILDALTHLHKDGKDNREIYQLEEDLLKILFEELIEYYKMVYGKGDVYQVRLRNLIEKICEKSRLAPNENIYDCELRKRYYTVIDHFYDGADLKNYFKLCKLNEKE